MHAPGVNPALVAPRAVQVRTLLKRRCLASGVGLGPDRSLSRCPLWTPSALLEQGPTDGDRQFPTPRDVQSVAASCRGVAGRRSRAARGARARSRPALRPPPEGGPGVVPPRLHPLPARTRLRQGALDARPAAIDRCCPDVV